MKLIFRHICYLVSLICLLSPRFIWAQEAVIYCVQLGVLKNPANISAESFKGIGQLHTEEASDGLTRVLLGKFNLRADAERALILISQKGYSTAFIVTRPAPAKAIEATPALPEKIFLAQIGAYTQGIPPEDLAKAVLQGSVYSEQIGTLTKVYVGTFNTADIANQVVNKLRTSGLTQTFKREMPSAWLKQLTLVKEARISQPHVNPPKAPLIATAPITFGDKATLIEDMGMFSNGSANDTIAIDGHIVPISAKESLFIGVLDPYNSEAYQPLVLRTGDSGKSWAEVIPTEYGNSINYIQFIDKKTIFLTTMWVIEGPGEVNLFRSDDAGKTWRKVSKIPRNDFICVSNYLHFSDQNKGKIVYSCSDDDYWVWETSDGGVKWKSKGKINETEFKKLKQNNLLDYSLKSSYTAANDPKAIFKQINTPDLFIIQLRDPKTKKFNEISRLGKWYQLDKNNKIVPK